ncbi:hypothetical protein PFTANZ_00848 [Plasmodium falciparum Tanzania (2000708)]|uniref:Surface antigen n=1 Tax=Plasmodium falciparum Tanzania (2000708) TaxID=1036725 RepID=A0A024WDZ8_PLAFA|nr:hypothetical protein PFTANZ_00848 [Plasmodium falciparum Tanzania (2000708)]
MKLHYFKILLLFAHPLNILLLSSSHVYNKKNPYIITSHTPSQESLKTCRSLCECDLYTSIYDNDPEMQKVIQEFDNRTSQRFEEYNERMIKNRQKCKEQCEKDIQKIILNDKIEKKLAEKFVTLDTNIQTNDIPICVCEKSVADKVETICLKCGRVLGGGVAPAWGLISGLGYASWSHYYPLAVAKAATDAGIKEATEGLGRIFMLKDVTVINWTSKITATNYYEPVELVQIVNGVYNMCGKTGVAGKTSFCLEAENIQPADVFTGIISRQAREAATFAASKAKEVTTAEFANSASSTATLTNTIIASVVAILVIVLVMIIIYLILRYRRKTKMKKKLQYIKLLNE